MEITLGCFLYHRQVISRAIIVVFKRRMRAAFELLDSRVNA